MESISDSVIPMPRRPVVIDGEISFGDIRTDLSMKCATCGTPGLEYERTDVGWECPNRKEGERHGLVGDRAASHILARSWRRRAATAWPRLVPRALLRSVLGLRDRLRGRRPDQAAVVAAPRTPVLYRRVLQGTR